MDYNEFRAAFLEALRESHLPTIGGVPSKETLDLRTTDRTLAVYLESFARDVGKPFHVSAEVSWRWNALQAARTATTEDDFLTELFGRDDSGEMKTEQPWLRIDLKLRAGLEWGRSIPMPSAARWAKWSREAIGRLESVEPLVAEEAVRETSSGGHAVLAWQGEPELKVICTPAGELCLASISVSAFQGIDLPRHWDDSERNVDEHPAEQLAAMFHRIRAALYAWGEVMDHLV
jgi:hypothetical protein